jgi:uncharacterized membrane protein
VTIEGNPIAPRRSRLMYPAFLFSVALNLLFIGGLATAAWHYHSRHASGEYGLLAFSRQLPAEHREAFREKVLAARASLAADRDSVRSAWLEANALLTTEPFDKEKYKAATAKLRGAESQFRAGLSESFADIAASVTPEERKLLKRWREKRKPHFLRHNSPAPAASDDKSD